MTTCLKEDVRSPIWEPVGTAADRPVDAGQDEIFHVGEVVRAEVVQVEVKTMGQPMNGSELVVCRARRLREAGFITAAVVGLMLVPSVQSLGLGVDPAGVSPSSQDKVRQSPQQSESAVSREVERLIGRD